MLRPYRETLLIPDERVCLIARPHIFTFLWGALRGLVLALLFLAAALAVEQWAILPPEVVVARPYVVAGLLVLMLLAAISAIAPWVRWRTHEIVVTDRRVIRISGVLSKEAIDYSLDAITDLRVRQSWLGRIFNYGDVDVLTASHATHDPHDTFPEVSRPIPFMHAVQEQRERRRLRISVAAGDARLSDTQVLPAVEPSN